MNLQPLASHLAFAVMLQELRRPEAYRSTEARQVDAVELVQTHASAVLLTATHAYKLKKPENLGFLDYSTPDLRRHFCQAEVDLNQRLAPDVYLGVAAILRLSDGHLQFSRIYRSDDAPMPDELVAGSQVIDYAVVMVRVPEEATLAELVRRGQLTPELVGEVARVVARFHHNAASDEQVARFGSLEVIRENWDENFRQMQPFIERTLASAIYGQIVAYVRAFEEQREALFEERQRLGRIRDCHGDLRLQHVYALGEHSEERDRSPSLQPPHLAILDCIEFNERFRYGDVASEVAFLAMELDMAGRSDLSRALVDSYAAASGDTTLRELLPFYQCYRACVRGKVMSLVLDQPEVAASQREAAKHQAAALFTLAGWYATGQTRPMLVMVGGLMGTGKSTIARTLQTSLGWPVCSSDQVRKWLAQLDPAAPQDVAFAQGIYAAEWTEHTYQALGEEAAALLQAGHSVMVDASFSRQRHREAMVEIARKWGANVCFVECVAPQEVILARLAARWARRVAGQGIAAVAVEASGASDGRPELYEHQRAQWEPVTGELATGSAWLTLDTSRPIMWCAEQVLTLLDVPHLACWLS
jgi:uncharacterized protein